MGRLRALWVRSGRHAVSAARGSTRSIRKRRGLASIAATLSLTAGTGLVALATSTGASATTSGPSGVSFTLSGCRNDGTITLPNGSGNYVCPDSVYTTGNLGKGWNELDLVPFRLEVSALHSTPSPNPYTVEIVVDNCQNSGSSGGGDGATGCTASGDAPGYDVISAPVFNAGISTGTCTVSSSGELYQPGSGTATGGLGGTGTSLYRTLTIHQTSGTDCFFDYYARLALGSHLFPGSSLHADLALLDSSGNLTTSGIGARDVSIPVKEISPQAASKTMSASENSAYTWNVTKAPSTTDIPFANTCSSTAGALQASLTVTVHYVREPASATGFTVYTDVYETNPASRTITVSGVDKIYSGTTLLATVDLPAQNVPANTSNYLMQVDPTNPLTYTSVGNYAPGDLPDAGDPSFNDTATLTYTDLVTGIPIPGNTSASFSLPNDQISNGSASNATADLTDDTTLTDSGGEFQYSIDSVSVSGGTFTDVTSSSPYTLGTKTTDEILWKLTGQSATVDPVTFGETVYVAQASTDTATLNDTAEALNGTTVLSSSGAKTVDLSAAPLVALTVQKDINVLLGTGDPSYTFYFDITGPASYSATKSVSFGSGDGGAGNYKSVTITGLQPGQYNGSEETPPSPWTGSGATSKTITPDPTATDPVSTCSGTITFHNTAGPASAQVKKITVPSGSESGWSFTLTGPGAPSGGETVTTTGTGFVTFQTVLEEGSYTVTEGSTTQPGSWFNSGVSEQENSGTVNDQTSAHQCTFTVNYPADADAVYSCIFTNTENATAQVKKITVPSGHEANWYFTLTGPGTPSGGETVHTTGTGFIGFSTLLQAGSYTVTETSQNGWANTGVSEQQNSGTANDQTSAHQCTFTVAYPDDADGVFSCTFTNTELSWVQVTKTLNGGSLGSDTFNFSLTGGPTGHTVSLTGQANSGDNGVVDFGYDSGNDVGMLYPGSYTICETTTLGPGWSTQWTENGNAVSPVVDNTAGTSCVTFTLGAGDLPFAFTVDNISPPGGGQRTIGYWKHWNSYTLGKAVTAANCPPLAVNAWMDCFLPQPLGADYSVTSAQQGVAVLSNPSSKYAENQLAAQLLAAELNVQAGASTCPAVTAAISHANDLLTGITYSGPPSNKKDAGTVGPSSPQRSDFVSTAGFLNNYNNGLVC